MVKNNLVSCIIPTLNEAKNIENCLKSITAQSHNSIEIIIVDNFSKDTTVQIAKKFTKKVYLKGPERSTQRNFGAKKAIGSYLLFLDADMLLTPNCLTQAIKEIQKGNKIIAFPETSTGQNYWEKSIALERNLYHREEILSAARLFPKNLFLKLRGYDENLIAGEDWDLTIRAKKIGCKISIDKSHIIHNEHVNNLKEILQKKAYYSANIKKYANKHPKEFDHQSNLRVRLGIYLKNWNLLASDPIHTFGFLLLKSLVWLEFKKIINSEKKY